MHACACVCARVYTSMHTHTYKQTHNLAKDEALRTRCHDTYPHGLIRVDDKGLGNRQFAIVPIVSRLETRPRELKHPLPYLPPLLRRQLLPHMRPVTHKHPHLGGSFSCCSCCCWRRG